MSTYQSLVGQQFGRLTVLEEFKNEKGKYYCKCLCSCGNEKVISKISLKSGTTRNCGCLQRERASSWAKKRWESKSTETIPSNTPRTKYKSLVGQQFGRLTVLEEYTNENGKY